MIVSVKPIMYLSVSVPPYSKELKIVHISVCICTTQLDELVKTAEKKA